MKKIITFVLILIVIKGLCQAQNSYLISNFDVVRYYSGDSLLLITYNDSITEFEYDGVLNGDTVEDCNGLFIKYLDPFDQRVILNRNHSRTFRYRLPAIRYSESTDVNEYSGKTIMTWTKSFKFKGKTGTITLYLPSESLTSTLQSKMTVELQMDCRCIQYEKF